MQTPPLVPVRARPAALVLAGLCWLGAGLLAARYAGTRAAGPLDASVTTWLRGLIGGPGTVARIMVAPTTPALVYAVVGIGAGGALLRRRWAVAALTVLGPALAILLTELAKPLVDRTYRDYLSYPSGHAVSAVSAYLVVTLALTAGWRPARRLAAAGALGALTAVLAAGLVGMNYHYPTDTIGGICVAIGVILPGAVLTDALAARKTSRRKLSAPPARPATAPPAGTPPAGTSSGTHR